jgi:hypothetical protein
MKTGKRSGGLSRISIYFPNISRLQINSTLYIQEHRKQYSTKPHLTHNGYGEKAAHEQYLYNRPEWQHGAVYLYNMAHYWN